jgi:transposase
VAEMIIAELAASLLQLDQRIQGLDQQIAATFRRHHQAMTIESMPGFGPILGAQLLPPTAPRRLRTSSRPQRVGSSCMTPTARST